MPSVLKELKRMIQGSATSRYVIARESGVSAGQLSRFMAGERSLSLESVERLLRHFGYELTIRRVSKRKGS